MLELRAIPRLSGVPTRERRRVEIEFREPCHWLSSEASEMRVSEFTNYKVGLNDEPMPGDDAITREDITKIL